MPYVLHLVTTGWGRLKHLEQEHAEHAFCLLVSMDHHQRNANLFKFTFVPSLPYNAWKFKIVARNS